MDFDAYDCAVAIAVTKMTVSNDNDVCTRTD